MTPFADKLSKKLNGDEEPQYEALCHLAVARCEHNGGNPAAEAEALIASARAFLRAQTGRTENGHPDYEEYLLSAINSYNHAINCLLNPANPVDDSASGDVCSPQPIRAAGLCSEIAGALRTMNRTEEAVGFYKRSAEIRPQSKFQYLKAKENLGECYIDLSDYHDALETFTDLADECKGEVCSDLYGKCEVFRVLLVLIIEPIGAGKSTAVLDKYSQTAENEGILDEVSDFMSRELFYLLQSVVMSVQVRDFEAVSQLEDQLIPLLDKRAKLLLRKLTKL